MYMSLGKFIINGAGGTTLKRQLQLCSCLFLLSKDRFNASWSLVFYLCLKYINFLLNTINH